MKARKQQTSGIRITLLITSLFFIAANFSFAANRFAVANGNWSGTSTWSSTSGGLPGASVPQAGDAVTIENGYAVTVDVNTAACASVQLGIPSTGNGTLTFLVNSILTVSGNVVLGQGSKTGSLNFSAGGLLQIAGSLTVTTLGTFTPGIGTIEYNGTAQTVATTTSLVSGYNNLTLSGSGVKTTSSVTVNGTLSMEGTATVSNLPTYGSASSLQYNTATSRTTGVEWSNAFSGTGGVVIANTGTITSSGNLVFNSGVDFTIKIGATFNPSSYSHTFNANFFNYGTILAGTGQFTIDGTANQSISGFETTAKATVTKTAGTATLTGNVTCGTTNVLGLNMNASGATLNLGSGFTHTFNGNVNMVAGTIVANNCTLNFNSISGTVLYGTGSILNSGTSTLVFAGAGNQIITATGLTAYNVTYSGSGTKTVTAGQFTVNNLLTVEGTAVGAGAPTYGTAASLVYNSTSSRASGAEWVTPFTATGGVNITNTGTITLNAAKTTNSTAPISIASGATLASGGFQLTVAGALSINGTLTAGSGSIVFSGTANQTVNGFTTTGSVTMSKTGGTVTFAGNVDAGALTINGSGGTLDLGTGLTHSISGNVTLTAGTLNGGSSTMNVNSTSATAWNGTGSLFTAGTGTVVFGGANQTISSTATTFNNLTFAGSGTKSVTNAPTINGTLTVDLGVTFDAGTLSIPFGASGSAVINGTFQTDNLVGFSGSSTAAIKSTNNPVITQGTNSTIEYSKLSGAQSISTGTYSNLKLSNTSATNTANGNIIVSGTLTTTSGGTFDLGTNTLAVSAVSNSGTLRTQNTSSAPLSSGITWGGTVNYNNTSGGQTIVGGTYTTLTLGNTSGTQTAGGNLTVTTLNHNTNTADILNMATFSLSVTTPTNTGTIRTQNTSSTALSSGKTWGGTVQYDATAGGQTIIAGTYGVLTISNTSGTNTAGGAFSATTFNTTAGGTTDMVTYALTVTTPAHAGILKTQNTSATPLSTGKTWGGTVEYNGASQTISSGTYNLLTISTSGTKTLGGATTTTGNLTIPSGVTLATSTFLLILQGDLITNGTFTSGSGGITLSGTANQSINGFTTTGKLTMAKTGGTATLTSNCTFGNSGGDGLVINGSGGTLNLGTGLTHTFPNGDITLSAGTLRGGSCTLLLNYASGSAWTGTGSVFSADTSKVVFGAAGNQSANASATTFYKVTFAGSGTRNISTNSFTVNDTLSIEGTSTISNEPTYGASATLYYNTASARTEDHEWPNTFTATGGIVIGNTGAITLGGDKVMSTSVRLVINSGATLNPLNKKMSFGGDYINNGTLGTWTDECKIIGTANQSISGFTTSKKTSMLKTAGTATLTGNCNFGSSGAGLDALIINGSGATLNMGTGLTHLFDTGDLTLTAGTLQGGSSTLLFTSDSSSWYGTGSLFVAQTSTVKLISTGYQLLNSPITFYNLTCGTSGVKTFTAIPTITNILSIEGTATVSASPIYGASATLQYNTPTSRTASSNEWITPFAASGGVVIANTGTITMNAAKVFSTSVPLTINSGASLATGNNALTLGGNFINNGGTFTAGSSNITLAGTATQSIAGFSTTGSVSSTKTAGTATFASAISGAAYTFNGNGGTLKTGPTTGFNVTGSSTLTLSDNASLTLGSGAHNVSFANSSAASWTSGKMLTISGWEGTLGGTAGTAGRIFAGSTSSGLTAGQISQIQFFIAGSTYSAMILPSGEVVPYSAFFAYQLVEFNATPTTDGKVNINWVIADESNVLGYLLERSSDNKNYFFVTQNAPGSNTTGMTVYEETDNAPFKGDSWYRLSTLKMNGAIEIHDAKHVYISGMETEGMNLYPNPLSDKSVIDISLKNAGIATILIVDINGREISKTEVSVQEGPNRIPVPMPENIPAGNVMVLLNFQGQTWNKKAVFLIDGN